jgi:hypothetical protein
VVRAGPQSVLHGVRHRPATGIVLPSHAPEPDRDDGSA